jgi:hypothetical protein
MDVTSLLEKAKCTSFGGAISLLNGLWPLVCWKGNDQNFPGLFPDFFVVRLRSRFLLFHSFLPKRARCPLLGAGPLLPTKP